MFDGHIHVRPGHAGRKSLIRKMRQAGVGGGILLSQSPHCAASAGTIKTWRERLDHVLEWCCLSREFYPFFWIDPLENDALRQAQAAVERGINGFKVICDYFEPGDRRAMKIFQAIAETKRPILFHSGILWDGKPSSVYNRPVLFEALLRVRGLKFSLAHISWPWCDELLAVYGKFLAAYTSRPELDVELFIDVTPGTPEIYRREALYKLFKIGYDVENNVIFGSDCSANDYNFSWVKKWVQYDRRIMRSLGVSSRTMGKVFGGNARRFLGLTSARVLKKSLRVAE
ncbi:MAG: amidohydrolase family protein [Kiritimatiellae bacterium]|nr:amidohydrolase family protein [Kiritimatiellia bacterium]